MRPTEPSPTPAVHEAPAWARATVVVSFLLTFAAVVVATPAFMVDDAWFYLQIGRNLGLGLGSTFDGEVATNGYHPLWQGLVGLMAQVTTEREALFAVALATQIMAVSGAMVLLFRAGVAARLPFPLSLPTALLLTQYSDQGWLSEGPVTAFFLAAVITALPRSRFLVGVLLGLLFLTRLDTVFFAASLVLLSKERARLMAGATAVAGPWLVWNLFTWGHLLPVSGAIKSTFPWPDLSFPLAKIGWVGLGAAIGSAVAIVLAARRPERRVLLGALGMGGMSHALYTALFTGPQWSTCVAYYWIISSVATAAAASELFVVYLGLLPSLSMNARRHLMGAVFAILGLGAAGRALRAVYNDADPTILLARWVAEELPESRLLVLDAPGRLAWFSGRPVFAIDGLTRNWGFPDELSQLGIDEWAGRNGITHVVGYDFNVSQPWCTVTTTETDVSMTFLNPRSHSSVGMRSWRRADALKRLTDFVPDDANTASLYAWLP